ncbi:hepcidin-1 isoform X2 [Heptranchias perlo]|uniref:hepcidin-1 isoform X2 n=1 Tax=Heptranchias perlo TaxID=212740 RepID=UPI00355A7A18
MSACSIIIFWKIPPNLLLKIETEHDSLTNEEAVDPPATGSLLLREKRWTHVPICLYCCGCCNKKGARITCGFCCKL